MTRSPETTLVFARDLQAVDDMNAGFWTQDHIEATRASTLARHEEYDARFALMVAEVKAVATHSKGYARDLLIRLGGMDCMSGMPEFRATCLALERMGVTGANHVFIHDRRHIATTYLPAKTKESA